MVLPLGNKKVLWEHQKTEQMKNDRKFAESWEKKRTRRWQTAFYFSLIYGILLFALIGAFDMNDQEMKQIYFSKHALIRLIACVAAGYFVSAFWMWRMNEERYKRIKKAKENKGI